MENFETIIKDTAKRIKKHRELELDQYIQNVAVALVDCRYDNDNRTFWIITRENISADYTTKADRNDEKPTRISGKALKKDGFPVYRNSIVGEHLLKQMDGKTRVVPAPKRNFEIKLERRTSYTPIPDLPSAENIRFESLQSDPKYFSKLTDILEEVAEIDKDIQVLTEAKEAESNQEVLEAYIHKINEKENQKKELFLKAQHFIRKNAELRYQPILDPWQESVKRSHLYDGTVLAINGGPGTGKTTSLIQRIRFLTDKLAMEEYLSEKSQKIKEKILNGENNWIFYSPNELLKHYLKNSMSAEGLSVDDSKIKVWETHKNLLVKKYGLFNSETQNPFLFLRKRGNEHLLPSGGRKLKTIIDRFQKALVSEIRANLINISALDTQSFSWHPLASNIKANIDSIGTFTSSTSLIKLYFKQETLFKDRVVKLLRPVNDELSKAAAHIVKEIEKYPSQKIEIEELIKKWAQEKLESEEDDDFEGGEDIDEANLGSQDLEVQLFSKLKSLVRKAALRLFDRSARFSKREQELLALLEGVFNPDDMDHLKPLGELLVFSRYYGKHVRGVGPNFFRLIPQAYKRFRKAELDSENKLWNLDLLKEIVLDDSSRNKRLHSEEQALLLYIINDLIKHCFKVSIRNTNQLNHPYLSAYLDAAKPVIGIDEATDFHPIDILCMESLSDWEIGAVTMSGDVLQRMTATGLRKWDDLSPFFKQYEVLDLIISYRQSPTLLEIAEKLHYQATGVEASYKSYTTKDAREPKPLFFQYEENPDDAAAWIAQRILEIFQTYGKSIPSIAIFVTDEAAIEKMASSLSDIDRLADNGILVKACRNGEVLGDSNTIRVFSIAHIKGLEFEAVFFHNIDELYIESSKDDVLKHLYVGLSRATFYLGATSTTPLNEMDFLEGLFDESERDWVI